MHHIALCTYPLHILMSPHVYAYTGISCGAEDGNSSGASTWNV
jgi:hypothetical protein